MVIKHIIVLFVETPRKFITARLSIRKPGSSSVLIIRSQSLTNHILSSLYVCLAIKHISLALMKIRAYGSKALQ